LAEEKPRRGNNNGAQAGQLMAVKRLLDQSDAAWVTFCEEAAEALKPVSLNPLGFADIMREKYSGLIPAGFAFSQIRRREAEYRQSFRNRA
jgi:hypothetical protein